MSGAPPPAGSLARLHWWWASQARGHERVVDWLDCAAPSEGTHDHVAAGSAAAEAACAAGSTLVVPLVGLEAAATDLAARSLIAVLAGKSAPSVVAQPPGRPDAEWMNACAAVRDTSARLHGLRSEPEALVTAAGSAPIAFAVGVLLATAERTVPVLLDGAGALAAALVADRIDHRAKAHWAWASTSTDPACAAAADRLLLEPLVALVVDQVGQGAAAALALLQV